MMAAATDENFDWVTAQAGCSATLMFQRLQEGARADVERRNAATFGQVEGWKFEFHEDEEGFEVVRVGGSRGSAVVTFYREGPRINVSGDGIDVMITAVVGINHAGECRYFVGEAEYIGWEVRKMALEQLFFEGPDE
jgi:hypothetical protein